MNIEKIALEKYPVRTAYPDSDDINERPRAAFIAGMNEGRGWISVEDKPLMEFESDSRYTATLDTQTEFLAAVPHKDSNQPGRELWWIRMCYISDSGRLEIVSDDDVDCGWELEDVTHYKLIEPPVK